MQHPLGGEVEPPRGIERDAGRAANRHHGITLEDARYELCTLTRKDPSGEAEQSARSSEPSEAKANDARQGPLISGGEISQPTRPMSFGWRHQCHEHRWEERNG